MNAVVNQLFDKLDTLNERISEIEQNTGRSNGVTVADVKMPFGSMVVFMVKWAIASIPAMIILVLFGSIAAGITSGVFSTFIRFRIPTARTIQAHVGKGFETPEHLLERPDPSPCAQALRALST